MTAVKHDLSRGDGGQKPHTNQRGLARYLRKGFMAAVITRNVLVGDRYAGRPGSPFRSVAGASGGLNLIGSKPGKIIIDVLHCDPSFHDESKAR